MHTEYIDDMEQHGAQLHEKVAGFRYDVEPLSRWYRRLLTDEMHLGAELRPLGRLPSETIARGDEPPESIVTATSREGRR